ncbi:MAG: trypsin-like peptidase domain-containing protein [Planctomycetota bacterium]
MAPRTSTLVPSRRLARAGNALVTFLVTALSLVTALALLLRFRPDLFGAPSGALDPHHGAAREVALPARPPEPEGPLARYELRPVSQAVPYGADEARAIELFRESTRSVCLVSSILREQEGPTHVTAGEHVQGTGSGILWDTQGHIVTNYHVVEGANAATVTLPDGSVHDAWLVGYDENFDLAVMRIDRPVDELETLRYGRSAELVVGQRVYSIGFPYGLGHTLSSGIVSGLERAIRTPKGLVLEGVIQTDADIHPGSSGGPLLDSSGRLVGICMAAHGEANYGAGLAFALPIDLVQAVVPEIMREGFEWFPRLGVVLASDTKSRELLALLRREGDAQKAEWLSVVPTEGVLVAIVEDETPAALAGLRGMLEGRRQDGLKQLAVRDIIVGIDGQPITNRDDLDRALHGAPAGQTQVLDVVGAAGRRVVSIVAN